MGLDIGRFVHGCSPLWFVVSQLIPRSFLTTVLGLDTTIAADVQQPIFERFGNIEDLAWIGLGFPMGSVAGILFIGRLYEMFNIKWLMNTSIIVFEIGSALCGAAPNMNALIVGRVIAGLGGSGMYIGYVQGFFPAQAPPTDCNQGPLFRFLAWLSAEIAHL